MEYLLLRNWGEVRWHKKCTHMKVSVKMIKEKKVVPDNSLDFLGVYCYFL
jgi:hypothetical protein